MTTIRTLTALSVGALATACASTGGVTAAAPSAPTDHRVGIHSAGASAAMASMDPRMKAMQEMHRKMTIAKTPEERQALMADHMKAMQDGMGMMKENSGMGAMAGKPPMAGAAAMAQRMDMMEMMMEMMMDRMSPGPAKK